METLNLNNTEVIKKAIKGKNWDKSSYAYAIGEMMPYNSFALYSGSYSLKEVKEEFYNLIPEHGYKLAKFTTFKNI